MKALENIAWLGGWLLVLSVMMALRGSVVVVAAQGSNPAFTAGLQAIGDRDMPRAVADLEMALEDTEESQQRAEIALLLGMSYLWNDQVDEAMEVLRAALSYDPQLTIDLPEQKVQGINPQAIIAACYKAKGDLATAIQWWEKVLARVPDASAIKTELLMARRKLAQAGQHTMGPMVAAEPSEPTYGSDYLPGRNMGVPDDWEGAPDNYKDLYLTVSAPRSLQLRPDQDIPLTFTLRNQGTETAYLTFSCGVRLTNAEGYLMLPVGRIPEPTDQGVYMAVDGERVHVVPVAELKPDEELGETLDDAIQRYHPLPAGTYTLVPVASLGMYDQDSVIRPEEEGWSYKTWAQPQSATSRFRLATEPLTIEIFEGEMAPLAEAQEQAISIQLVMEQRTFLSGEPVPVTIRMKNVSNRRLITDQLFKQATERIDKLSYCIQVVDSTGDRLPPMYPTDAPGIPDGRPEVLGPDWTRTVSLSDLREHFRFLNKPGTYTVQVRFGLCLYEAIRADGSIPWQSPSWSGVIESNKLGFTILEEGAERPQPQPSFEEWEEAANMLELSLSLDKDTYMLGEEINATCTVTNPSTLPLSVLEPARDYGGGDVLYEIRDLDTGETLPQPPSPKISAPAGININRVGEPVILQPGEKVSYTWDLTKDYLFHRFYTIHSGGIRVYGEEENPRVKVGRYTVKAIYTLGTKYLVSNEVSFRLTALLGQKMSLAEARTMVRVAREAYDRGDYAEALRLARKVLEERGNVEARWPGPGAKLPAPDADIYDHRAFIDAQNRAARATGAEVIIRVDGSSPRKIIFHATYKMGDWEATARMAEDILRRAPDSGVARSMLRAARAKLTEAKQAQAQEMSLEEARTMVRIAREAYDRGDYAEALRLARKVLEERGNVVAAWVGPGAKHPAPEADIYDRHEFVRAQNLAARETGAEVIIRVEGSSPRKIIFHAIYKMGDWEATARMAEEILRETPHSGVARLHLKIARAKMAEAKQPLAPLVTYPEGSSLYIVGEGLPREGQLWVALRAAEEVTDARVTWDQATGSATMLVGNHTFTVWPNRQEVLVDGELRPLTAAPHLDKDRLMVPVHFLARALDREVKWEAESRLLHIVPKIAWVR